MRAGRPRGGVQEPTNIHAARVCAGCGAGLIDYVAKHCGDDAEDFLETPRRLVCEQYGVRTKVTATIVKDPHYQRNYTGCSNEKRCVLVLGS